jgi:hypothetical protein
LALALGAIALGQAVQVANGNLHPGAIAWLVTALLACLVAVSHPPPGGLRRLGIAPVLALAGLGIAAQLIELLSTPPGLYLQLPSARAFVPFLAGIVLASLLVGAGFARESWLGPFRVPLILLVHLGLGIWMIRATPSPYIDVYIFQRDATAALLRGVNPYAITFPDIYQGMPFYGPGVSVNGRLTFGFPYPPLSLLMALPGHLLAGDYRYSQLVAMTASGALMAYSRPGPLASIAASLFLFTPRAMFVLEQGWTEPLVLLALAGTIFVACRAPRYIPICFGLFLAAKQYCFLAVPSLALLMPRPFRWSEYGRALGEAMLVAVAITLPFFLWDIHAFMRSVIALQLHQPFRPDALSFLSWSAEGEQHWPTWLSLAAAIFASALALWRGMRSPMGFASAVALTLLGFFAFNKQAFCNYYFLVIGACALGMATSNATSVRDDLRTL